MSELMPPRGAVTKWHWCSDKWSRKCKKLGNGLHCNKTQEMHGCLSSLFLPSPEMLDCENVTPRQRREPILQWSTSVVKNRSRRSDLFIGGIPGLAVGACKTCVCHGKKYSSFFSCPILFKRSTSVTARYSRESCSHYLLLLHHKNAIKLKICGVLILLITPIVFLLKSKNSQILLLALLKTKGPKAYSIGYHLAKILLFAGIVIFLVRLLTACLVGRCCVCFLTRPCKSLRS